MTQKAELSSMTDAQLRAYLFDVNYDQMSFTQATANYMQTLIETEAQSEKTASETMTSETDSQNNITSQTQQSNQNYINELQKEQQMQPSSLPSWLSDVISAFSVLAAVVTLNPVLIGISSAAFMLQVSGLQQKMMQAACGDDPSKQAAFSFGFAMGEALVGGAASAGGDVMAAANVTEDAAEATTQTAGQVAKNFVKYTATYLGQALMLDNFWPEFFQGPCKMSQEDATILGMFMGIGFGVASTAAASASEDAMTSALRNRLANLSDPAHTIFRIVMTSLNLMGDGFQIASGVDGIEVSKQFKKLSEFEKDVIAPTMGQMALLQSAASGLNSMITQTENALQAIADDSAANNQTFSSFADMFRPAQ